jgi:eukaryotic-like serine/threonine-protein kinase
MDVIMRHGGRRAEGWSRLTLAVIRLRMGELEAAEEEARRAVGLLDIARPMQVEARGTLANVLLARGRPAEALAEAREAMALLGSISKVEGGDALARLTYAEALDATGDHVAACTAIAEARDRLLATAARIDDPKRRKTFLENVRENARTLLLARQWLSEADDALP